MNVTDFTNYKFRPHAIFNIMGGLPKSLTSNQEKTLADLQAKEKITDKQKITLGSLLEKKLAKPTLSESAKKYLQNLYKEIVFNRSKEIQSKYLDKGILVEQQNIDMYNRVNGVFLMKNDERFENDFFSGEPDIIENGVVYDFKSSWDFSTFPMFDDEVKNINYFYQLQAYMDILNFNESKLIYGLVDTPDDLISDEKRRLSWKLGFVDDLPLDLEFEVTNNLTYQDIPEEMRIKEFAVKRDQAIIDQMHYMVELSRNYLNELSIKVYTNVENYI